MMTVGSALRRARKARGMLLSQVAEAAGISTATLSRIENENQGVDVARLRTLAGILDVSAADMVGDEGQDNEQALVAALSELSTSDRARLMVAAGRQSAKKRGPDQLRMQLDVLLATIDMIRDELAELRPRVRRRR